MDYNQAKSRNKQREQWAKSDPFTLVSAAKHTLFSEIQPQGQSQQLTPEQLAPLEEVISRFEDQCRAIAGVTQVGSGQ